MRRILLVILLVLTTAVTYGADEWREGDGTNTILGTESVSDIDTKAYQNIVAPLDRMLGKYKRGADLEYNSASSIDITTGEVACRNTAGSITRMRANTSTTTLTWADLDTGAEASSTTYYVYAVADADATVFTGVISVNSSTPDSGAATYYKLLGSFENDADGDIVDSSIVAPEEEVDIAIETVYDYGSSSSSSTTYTTGVFAAHGTLTVAGSSCTTVSNLPFASTSSFSCTASHNIVAFPTLGANCYKASASTVSVCNGDSSSQSVNWIAIGN